MGRRRTSAPYSVPADDHRPSDGSTTRKPAKYRRKKPRSRVSNRSAVTNACAPIKKSEAIRTRGPPAFRYCRQKSAAFNAATSVIGANEIDNLPIAARKPCASPKAVAVSAKTTSEATREPSRRQRRKASEEGSPNSGSAPKTSSKMLLSTAVITAYREAPPRRRLY